MTPEQQAKLFEEFRQADAMNPLFIALMLTSMLALVIVRINSLR
jgi:hypothetical protein